MSYYNERRKIINQIDEEMKPLSLTQLNDVLSLVKEKKPIELREHIKKSFEEGRIGGIGCQDINNQPAILQAFEHEIRAICLELGPDFKKIETSSQYIDHFCEMYVQGHELDIWIHENGSLFNPCELAFVIYLLYTGEVVFR